MTHDNLDRLLSSEDSMTASSGFAARVMDAVCSEAAAPPSPSFPWARFVIGLISLAAAAWAAASLLLRSAAPVAAAFEPLRQAAPEIIYASMFLFIPLFFLLITRVFTRE